ncbi:MAG: pectin esterase [Oscillospiraceae bacterium]|nr:pectin esterase [Oscillospiraceae bacterium]
MSELFARPGDDLQKLLDAAAPGTVIRLAPGVYRQKLRLTAPGLTLLGAGASETLLVWDDYAKKIHPDGREYNTFRTWTLAVCADGVTMRGITVANDALRPEEKGQEVALSVYGDQFLMEDCVLTSTQDTLFLGPLPRDLTVRYVDLLPPELREDRPLSQRFARCRVEGTVDFIFGCGAAMFEDCELRSLADARGGGYIAAPAHASEQTEGFVFRRCALTHAPGVAPGSIYLARPWRDYGLVRFENCSVAAHIAPAGFDKWNDSERDKTARFYETPAVPGRVPWCNRD